MEVKTFKTIYRIDFPKCYTILDKMGYYQEKISAQLKKEPFEEFKGSIDTVNWGIKNTAIFRNDSFESHMNLQTLDAVIQHKEGYNLDVLARHPLIKISEDIIKELEQNGLNEYSRIGLRAWILIKNPSYTFEKLLKYFCKSKNIAVKSVEKIFAPINDIGIVIESKNKEDVNLRLSYGPYKSDEAIKYFSFESPIKEGIILDIDLYQVKIELLGFELTKLIRKYQNIMIELVSSVDKEIMERIDED